jgi:hypothetical protein
MRIAIGVCKYAQQEGLEDPNFRVVKKGRGLEGLSRKAREVLNIVGISLPSDKPITVRKVWLGYLEEQQRYRVEYEVKERELGEVGGSLEGIRDLVKGQSHLEVGRTIKCGEVRGEVNPVNRATVFWESRLY